MNVYVYSYKLIKNFVIRLIKFFDRYFLFLSLFIFSHFNFMDLEPKCPNQSHFIARFTNRAEDTRAVIIQKHDSLIAITRD